MKRLEEIYNECECNKKSEILEAMKKYAEECVKASLEKASENWKQTFDRDGDFFQFVEPKSITNPENIVLL